MLSKFLKNAFSYFSKIMALQGPVYRIVKVDIPAHEVTFRIRNKAILVKYDFSEAINDLAVVNNLSPCEACWLGAYFGRSFRTPMKGDEEFKQVKNKSFSLAGDRGQYKIIFQNRAGEIGYRDKKTNKEFVENPLAIASNKYVISKFDPSHACFIGILAGMSVNKIGSEHKMDSLKSVAKLRLVK